MRIVVATILLILCSSSPCWATQTQGPDVSWGRNDENEVANISARLNGQISNTTSPTVTTKRGVGTQVITDRVDCNALDPTLPATPAAVRDCAVPTPRLGVQQQPQIPLAQQRAEYAIDYFRSVVLPKPVPKMSSPDAVTGAVHYLDLQVPQQFIYQDPDTAFGPLVLHVSAVFEINWGDGTKDKTAISGSPGITSKLNHYWTNKGSYNITATAYWTATWSFGSSSGVLSGPTTSGTINNWQVKDLQAVITGG